MRERVQVDGNFVGHYSRRAFLLSRWRAAMEFPLSDEDPSRRGKKKKNKTFAGVVPSRVTHVDGFAFASQGAFAPECFRSRRLNSWARSCCKQFGGPAPSASLDDQPIAQREGETLWVWLVFFSVLQCWRSHPVPLNHGTPSRLQETPPPTRLQSDGRVVIMHVVLFPIPSSRVGEPADVGSCPVRGV